MPITDTDEFQAYYIRIRPIFSLLYNIAHLITGNADSAEYCIQCAILDCWLAGESTGSVHGFRESIRSRCIKISKSTRNESDEFDWSGLQLNDTDNGPILVQLKKEPVDHQRILALHYCCGFSAHRCAVFCKTETRKARAAINRFERRITRKLSPSERRRSDTIVSKTMREILSRTDPAAPELSAVFRTFQADAQETQRPSHLPARILRIIFTIILTILCVVGFFLAAVLMQPVSIQSVPDSNPQTVIQDNFNP